MDAEKNYNDVFWPDVKQNMNWNHNGVIEIWVVWPPYQITPHSLLSHDLPTNHLKPFFCLFAVYILITNVWFTLGLNPAQIPRKVRGDSMPNQRHFSCRIYQTSKAAALSSRRWTRFINTAIHRRSLQSHEKFHKHGHVFKI